MAGVVSLGILGACFLLLGGSTAIEKATGNWLSGCGTASFCLGYVGTVGKQLLVRSVISHGYSFYVGSAFWVLHHPKAWVSSSGSISRPNSLMLSGSLLN